MGMLTEAAVVHDQGGPFTIENVELDEPRAHEVVLRMVATGLCHTDLSARAGLMPFPLPGVLGHEGAGVVEAVGAEVTRVVPGDHVVASFSSCGSCPQCTAGRPYVCHSFHAMNLFGGTRPDGSPTIRLDGRPVSGHFFGQSSFARHALVDERCVVPVPQDAPLAVLAPLGCGIQTGAGAVLNVLRPEPGATVVVFGAGAVGMAAVMAAAVTPAARVIAVDRVASRLALALQLGATDVIDGSSTDARQAVLDLTGGRGADATVEATGSTAVLEVAVQVLAPRGTCAVAGTYGVGTTFSVGATFMLDGRRILGVSEGESVPELFIPALVRLHGLGKLPVERLVQTYRFADIEAAAQDAATGRTIKPVLVFE